MPDQDPAALAQRTVTERDTARAAAREILAAYAESRHLLECDLLAWIARFPWLSGYWIKETG